MKPTWLFKRDLRRSVLACRAVKRKLERQGCLVTMPEIRERPDLSQREAYRDGGDLIVRRPGDTADVVVEVKGRSFDFIDNGDSFPHATVFVESDAKFRRPRAAPLAAYYMVNRRRTHALVVLPETRPHWVPERPNDRRARMRHQVLGCPKELTKVVVL